jgi:hypothetical protein
VENGFHFLPDTRADYIGFVAVRPVALLCSTHVFEIRATITNVSVACAVVGSREVGAKSRNKSEKMTIGLRRFIYKPVVSFGRVILYNFIEKKEKKPKKKLKKKRKKVFLSRFGAR